MRGVIEVISIALLLVNLAPAAFCLLLGALRWAATFLVLGAAASLAIVATAAAAATAADALPRLPAWTPCAAALLTALGLELLIAARFNRLRKPGPATGAPDHPTNSRARDADQGNWIVRFHDAIHGALRR